MMKKKALPRVGGKAFLSVTKDVKLFHNLCELSTSFEFHNFLSGDLDGSASSGVLTHASCFLLHVESTETNKSNLVTLTKSFRNCAESCVESGLSLNFC